ncbi:hypothetical protein ILUMI_05425 [Ignelater luminosus]|uniref:MARVEL domain-containing protein n=1 Tax=Ignelater luminosus TaxID=2038154 RepID=A0A8K0DHQ2_IGNLU|nr:hypothetical protein ILUMI_05425 [Ignelater luminosus]
MMTETVVNVQDAPNSNAANKQQSERHGLEWIKINLDYFKTVPGIIKLLQLLFGIICMSTASAYWESGTHWFIFVATVSFIGTLIWVFIYFLGIREATVNYPINWILTELLNTAICAVCYFIAFIVQLCVWAPSPFPHKGANLAAGVFGIFQTILYGFGTYLLYIESKRN